MPKSPPTPIGPSADQFIVRHGVMRFMGVFDAPSGFMAQRQEPVIAQTDRGTEAAHVLCPATPQAVASIPEPTRGRILRLVTPDDLVAIQNVAEKQKSYFTIAEQLIRQHHLAMQLVDAELIFGGERLVFYFISESRVDFRELVKSMAREFHTRIELRQIGVRDEAKLLADYGDCGKPVCCNTHMAVMPPVSMRMAKLQKSTLDPSKISGRCGRLKCCLRFEQDVYEEHQAELPPLNSRIVTNTGKARVLAHEVLARRLLVEFEDGRRLPISLSDVLTRL
jgi:cell fate regulator YaaT (PSP1 superfamily)